MAPRPKFGSKSFALRLSTVAILLSVMTAAVIDIDLKNWKEQRRVIEHDVHSYYGYLPAHFIYDDITLEGGDYEVSENYYYFWPNYTEDGRKVMKMSMGLSILYAPFFFIAHGYATVNDAYPATGFSEPYKVMLLVSALFYLLLGLMVLRKLLLKFGFSDKVTAVTLLLIGTGTNLLAYSSQSAPNVHVYNFFLFALFMFLTVKWHDRPTVKRSIAAGLVFGLISLVRPSNAVVALIFLLYGVGSISELTARVTLFLKQWKLIALMAVMCLLIWAPQLYYWKLATGNWVYYSYNEEGFFFGNPKIIKGLFSFRKGWLVYTPMMVFALAGLFVMRGASAKWRMAVIVFTAVNIYVIFSWWCWWYGGTFGQRTMVESYALLAIPFASFIAWIGNRSRAVQWAFAAVSGFFIWLNIFQTYQFENHILHYDGMSRALYFKQFGKMDKIDDFHDHVDWPDYDAARERGQ